MRCAGLADGAGDEALGRVEAWTTGMPPPYAGPDGGVAGPAPPPTAASAAVRRRRGLRSAAGRASDRSPRGCWWPARRAGRRCSGRSRPTPGRRGCRWNRSRCMPSASARIALITSPWLTATQTASGPVLGLDRGVAAAYGGDRAGLHLRAATPRRGRSPPTAGSARSSRAAPWPAPSAAGPASRRSRTR